MTMDGEALSLKLFEIGAVQFGDFTLKSGMHSPVYIDLRLLVGHPALLAEVARAMARALQGVKCDRLAGIAYAGIPIATAISLESGKPMIYTRKEVKDYGTKKAIEGSFNAGEHAVLVDDLITTSASKLEAAVLLRAAGLLVGDVLVFLDRGQGGTAELEKAGLKLHACLTLSQLLETLERRGKITKDKAEEVRRFLAANRA